MKKRICIHYLFLMVVLITTTTFSQKVGTTSMQFLKVMPCARATAMGDAYSVLATGSDAVFWNPGGMALVQGYEFSSTLIVFLFDTKQGALSYAMSLGDIGAIGLQMQYIDYGVFDEAIASPMYLRQIPNPGLTGRQFRPFSYLIGVSYARSLTDRFSMGVSAKYAHESLFDDAIVSVVTQEGKTEDVNTFANTLLFDFGLQYNTGFRTVRIAASVQNFGADIKYARESNPAPLLFRLGIAADLIGENSLLFEQEGFIVRGAFDLFQPNDYTQQMHAGLEYEFANTIALRMGYKFNYDVEGFTAGGGLHQNFGNVKLSLDYSYGSYGVYLGNVHRISLGVGLL
jgi:hypothetical protein